MHWFCLFGIVMASVVTGRFNVLGCRSMRSLCEVCRRAVGLIAGAYILVVMTMA